MGCSSCRKGGFNASVRTVQQASRIMTAAIPAMNVQPRREENMDKYKLVYYIGNPGNVTGTVHKSYGTRAYGEQLYVHVNDINPKQFTDTMPTAPAPNEIDAVELSDMVDKKIKKRKITKDEI